MVPPKPVAIICQPKSQAKRRAAFRYWLSGPRMLGGLVWPGNAL